MGAARVDRKQPNENTVVGLRRATANEIRNCVRRIMCGWPQKTTGQERRRARRQPYLHAIDMTPVSETDTTPIGKNIVVLGKQLSDFGLDFYYREPLHYRRMIASFPTGDGRWTGLLLDLTWCRFGRHGLYENGGRFLRVTASPLESERIPSTSREIEAQPFLAASRLHN